MGRVKVITHNDLDGVACGILGKLSFGDECEVVTVNYDAITQTVLETLKQINEYERIYITDISVSPETARVIDTANNPDNKILLFDHHQTAKHLVTYQWATIEMPPESGASLFYKYLKQNNLLPDHESIKQFVELVRQYDTWEWAKVNNPAPVELNSLYHIYGNKHFVDVMLKRFKENKDTFEFTETDRMLLEIEETKIKNYVDAKAKTLIKTKWNGYNTGILFAETYIPQITEHVMKNNTDIDILMIVQPDKVISLRTAREDINVGMLAKMYGGGGHPKAAGITVDSDFPRTIAENILSILQNKQIEIDMTL